MDVLFPGPYQVVGDVPRVDVKAVKVIEVESLLAIDILNDFTVEHRLAVVFNSLLFGRHAVNKPPEDVAPAAAACVFGEPPIREVLDVDLHVHDLSPLLERLYHVIRLLNSCSLQVADLLPLPCIGIAERFVT